MTALSAGWRLEARRLADPAHQQIPTRGKVRDFASYPRLPPKYQLSEGRLFSAQLTNRPATAGLAKAISQAITSRNISIRIAKGNSGRWNRGDVFSFMNIPGRAQNDWV